MQVQGCIRRCRYGTAFYVAGRRHWHVISQVRAFLVVPAIEVKQFLSQKPNYMDIYGDHALARMSGTRRGKILENVVRSAISKCDPNVVIEDPDLGQTVNGVCRGQAQAEYDWKSDGRRVECKSAMLTWREGQRRWGFTMSSVKLPLERFRDHAIFDELMLALFTPRGIYVYAHDMRFGVTASGKVTASRGHNIHFRAPCHSSWSDALDRILNGLDSPHNSCQHVLHIPLSDACLQDELQKELVCDVFQGKPLADMSASQRGRVIQGVVLHVDKLMNASSCFKPAIRGICINGAARPQHCAPYDWIRDGLRIECKSAKLLFIASSQSWKFSFCGVKLCSFDELLLALYTPIGIYVYRHDLKLGLSKTGVALQSAGYQIKIQSHSNTPDWKSALLDILAKLDSSGCDRLALVKLS
eukprot:TRINITY_DN7617_c0_g1_i3.p1 TRINITY_DN7617_c0_g1~~TRINITY_DN7617_c0_g1_i3.p1  ORF type:complete len:414 (-),score=37.51 TRINITY_DN7617_c0_g1_i3:198-1439(-)